MPLHKNCVVILNNVHPPAYKNQGLREKLNKLLLPAFVCNLHLVWCAVKMAVKTRRFLFYRVEHCRVGKPGS